MNRAAIEFLVKHEETGKVFFNRGSNDGLTVFIRDPRLWGGNPNVEHWALAQEVFDGLFKLGVRLTRDIKIDRQSGTLVIQIDRFYTSQAEVDPEFDASVGE